MTGQLPLTITDLQCTPAAGATDNEDVTAMTPTHKHQPAFGNQQDAILILGHIARGAPAPLARSCSSAHWRPSARGTSLGGSSCACSRPIDGLLGVENRKLRSEGGGGRATR